MLISDTAVKQRTTVFVLTLLILIAGLFSYLTMPREAAPEIIIPFVFVDTNYRGVSPEDIENSITKEIEEKLKGLKNVKKIRSTSSEGKSSISIEFVTGTDIDNAIQKVKDKVDEAKPELPSDLDDEPSVYEKNFSEEPILVLGLSGTCGGRTLRQMAEKLEEAIEGVPGILGVDVSGGDEREIQVEIDPDRMILYGVPFAQLEAVIRGENANVSGGSISTRESRLQLRIEGEFESTRQAEEIVVMTQRDGSPVYLRDIARVKDHIKEATSLSRLNGRNSVNLLVRKRSGANILHLVEAVNAVIDATRPSWPAGTTLTRLDDRSKQIKEMVSDLENNIISGLILVVAVVCLAMGLRNALLVSLSIPLSMLMGFMILKALGITLNMVVLFSLTLSLGMLVDNAIVIIENIYRYMQQGTPRLQAAMKATSEVAFPIIGSGLTTIAAFFPLLWWDGVMGGFMVYLPRTVITVLGSCLFVALVINPAMAAVLMQTGANGEDPNGTDDDRNEHDESEHAMLTGGGPIIEAYRKILRFALGTSIPKADEVEAHTRTERMLRHLYPLGPRIAVLILAGLCFLLFGLFWSYQSGKVELFPDLEPDRAIVSMDIPEGSDLAAVDEVAREIERKVYTEGATDYPSALKTYGHKNRHGTPYQGPSDIMGIESAYTNLNVVGGTNQVTFKFIDMPDRVRSSEIAKEMITQRIADVAGAHIIVKKPEGGPPTGAPITVELIGEDLPTLGQIAREVRRRVAKVPFTTNIQDDYSEGSPTLLLRLNRKRTALLGLNSNAVGFAIRSAINGIEISTYRDGDEDYDIVMRLDDSERHSPEILKRLLLPTTQGVIPLSTIATIKYVGGLGAIKRVDHNRVVTVTADIQAGKTTGDEALKQTIALMQGKGGGFEPLEMPVGYRYRFAGENEESEKASAFLSWALMVALGLIFLILVSQFNSVIFPFIILSSVVLSLGGVFLGMGVHAMPFGIIMTGVGVISLAGVVVNNAIVLIDYTILLRDQGMERDQAIIAAGATRLRPVLLTAVTTVLSLIPMITGTSIDFHPLFNLDWPAIVSGSESSQWWKSMAVAVAWGLVVATALTLVVVPVLFSLLDDLNHLAMRAFRKTCKKLHP
ncbi:MAG: efflux RND transporter permease subunit [Planctomycetota bacterium]|jgi:multidrug efflux pump subunit AcrB